MQNGQFIKPFHIPVGCMLQKTTIAMKERVVGLGGDCASFAEGIKITQGATIFTFRPPRPYPPIRLVPQKWLMHH